MYILCMLLFRGFLCFTYIIVITLTSHFHVRGPQWVGCNTTRTTLPIPIITVVNDWITRRRNMYDVNILTSRISNLLLDISKLVSNWTYFTLVLLFPIEEYHIWFLPHYIVNGGNIKSNVREAFYCSLLRETINWYLGLWQIGYFMLLEAIYGIWHASRPVWKGLEGSCFVA